MRVMGYRFEAVWILLFAAAHALAFHDHRFSLLTFVSLVPLGFALRGCQSRKEALAVGYAAGVIQSLFLYYWILHVTVMGYFAMAVYLGVFVSLFALLGYRHARALFCEGARGFGYSWIKIIHLSALWTVLEWTRSQIPVMRFPWALLSYSQWKNTVWLQSADLFGAFGLSWVMAFVNFSILGILLALSGFFRKRRYPFFKAVLALGGTLGALLGVAGANVGYGEMSLSAQVPPARVVSRVSLVQGNVPQEDKWNDRIKRMIFGKYTALTRQLRFDDPDLVIWPETSFPGFWEAEPEMARETMGLARELQSEFLIGVPTFRESDEGYDRMNTALHLARDGRERARYNKIRLVPFGEYIPFFQFLRKYFSDIGRFSPGDRMTLFDLPVRAAGPDPDRALTADERRVRFAVLICFEDIFADLCRSYAQMGARCLVNITNDAWFKNSSGPYQHAQASVLRAVENRVTVIRAANTGLSCVIDPWGRIVSTLEVNGKEILVTGIQTQEIPFRPRQKSCYTQWGDFAVGAAFFAYLVTRPFGLRRLEEGPIREDGENEY